MGICYNLHLQNEEQSRVALYDPYLSKLTWKDSGEEIIPSSHIQKIQVLKVSPSTPVGKVKTLRKIKIQMGFACNYSCTYCSQNNQRAFQKDTAQETLNKVEGFLTKMPSWFDGGQDGKGEGVHLEFWGGETLLYWAAVEKMAQYLREKYPNISLALFTNGSIITKEMADRALELKLLFIISHDGPTFTEDRAKDPLDVPHQRENLLYLFNLLQPHRLVSFNATISPKNYSLLEIRKYIATKLCTDPKNVRLTHDLATPYDSAGMSYVSDQSKRNDLLNGIFDQLVKQYPFDLNVGMVDVFINDFFDSLLEARHAETVGQKCSMDQPTSIAVDIDGNVLTCQNVTAKGGHKIGHIDQFNNVQLNTAYHWSTRKECVQCPVVQICKGACMFLENKLWEAACDQHFTWSLAYLSLAIYLQTNFRLTMIDGAPIRKSDVTSVSVLRAV